MSKEMKLQRLTERVWVYPYEEARDRPNLGYIRGNRWSLAVDAGHSKAHTESFYRVLAGAGLPLPEVTVLTHWHWDHTFGMHAVHGLCMANARTNEYLSAFREKVRREGRESFLSMDECIRREYAGDRPVIIALADLVFTGELWLEAGDCPVHLLQAPSPHTDDTTLVHVPGERVLFLGDSVCGVFPTWEKDPALCRGLRDTIAALDVDQCVYGHWRAEPRQEVLLDLES